MAVAEHVTKLHAVCVRCGAPANHSQRIVAQGARVLVGEAEAYEPRCRRCFRPEGRRGRAGDGPRRRPARTGRPHPARGLRAGARPRAPVSMVTIGTSFVVLALLASVVLGWIADLRRTGGAVSAHEARAQAERAGRSGGRTAFYTSREDRAEAMRERIVRERRRRERARAAHRPRAAHGAAAPRGARRPTDRPCAGRPRDAPPADARDGRGAGHSRPPPRPLPAAW